MKVNVYMRTYAHYTAEVELTDAELERLATDLEKPVSELDLEDIREIAEDKAFTKGVPGLCHMEMISLSDWDATEDSVEIVER